MKNKPPKSLIERYKYALTELNYQTEYGSPEARKQQLTKVNELERKIDTYIERH